MNLEQRMDLYRVSVESCEPLALRLKLTILSLDEVTFPISPSFAMMLIDDEGAGQHQAYKTWRRAQTAADESFDPHQHIVSVRLVSTSGLPRDSGQPPAGMTRDDLDDAPPGVLGEAIYEITVDTAGMLGHLAPGMHWKSTAFNELDDGPTYFGRQGDATEWRRG